MKWILSSVLLVLLPLSAAADGKVFPTALEAEVKIPDQRALIHFTNGVERLVIETRFTGSGTNFAWVVPLPSQPVVEEASTGLFPTLQYLFRPEIVHRVPRYYLAFLAVLGIGYLMVSVRPTGRMTWLDVTACVCVGIGTIGVTEEYFPGMVGGIVVCSLLVANVYLIRAAWSSAVTVVVLTLSSIVLVMLFLPLLATAKARGSNATASADKISILDRQLVGVFETTTISSRDPTALQTWLRENGFVVSSNSAPVIESYVKDGWVFVAAKVRRDKAGAETSTPHPLSFTFKTDKAVYPMRLTGVDNDSLQVDLYVFANERAIARNFKVECCTLPAYPELLRGDFSRWRRSSPETPNILHPLLRKWVDGSPVATKLTATLAPADMRQDVWLEWSTYREKKNQIFSRQGAVTYGLNMGAGAFAAGVILLSVFAAGSETRKRLWPRRCAGLLVCGVLLAGLTYLVLPKTEVRFFRNPYGTAQSAAFELGVYLMDGSPVTHAELSAEARQLLTNRTNNQSWLAYARRAGMRGGENLLLGGEIREEDSPGNFTIRENGDELEFVAYDSQGAEHVLTWTRPLRQP